MRQGRASKRISFALQCSKRRCPPCNVVHSRKVIRCLSSNDDEHELLILGSIEESRDEDFIYFMQLISQRGDEIRV